MSAIPCPSNIEAAEQGDLFEFLDRAATRFPDRPHITFEGRSWSYASTHRQSLTLANSLLKMGIRQGDRVGICMANSPAYVVICFALWRIGAVGVGMSPLYSHDYLKHQIDHADPSLLFLSDDTDTLDKLNAIAGRVPVVRCRSDVSDLEGNLSARDNSLAALMASEPIAADHPRPDPQALAMLQFTGGTTGQPKGAMLTHRSLRMATHVGGHLLDRARPGEESWHAPAPLSHISGLLNYVCIATALGGEIRLVSRFSPDELLDRLREGAVSIVTAIPTMVTALLALPEMSGARWDKVKHVVAGGAAVPEALARSFYDLSGLTIQQAYGMTETSGVGVFIPSGDGPESHAVTGRIAPGIVLEVRSTDDPAVAMECGQTGEICIGGSCLMDGYWRAADAPDLYTPDGLLRTGDIGVLDEDGYLKVVDRLKDLIICSGYNVFPRTIDEAVAKHPSVQEAIAVGLPDSYRGETVAIAVVPRPGHEVTLDGLTEFLVSRLSPIEMPKKLFVTDSLPRTENAKLSRRLTREWIEARQ